MDFLAAGQQQHRQRRDHLRMGLGIGARHGQDGADRQHLRIAEGRQVRVDLVVELDQGVDLAAGHFVVLEIAIVDLGEVELGAGALIVVQRLDQVRLRRDHVEQALRLAVDHGHRTLKAVGRIDLDLAIAVRRQLLQVEQRRQGPCHAPGGDNLAPGLVQVADPAVPPAKQQGQLLVQLADYLEAVLGLRLQLAGEEVDGVALADERVALAGHSLGQIVERARRREHLDGEGARGELGASSASFWPTLM